MLFLFCTVSAYLIKSLITNDYIGLDEYNYSLILTSASNAADIEIEPFYNSAFIKFKIPGYGYFQLIDKKITLSNYPSLFNILYTFNGGFLIFNNSLCLAQNSEKYLTMKPCNSKTNKFLVMTKTSLTTGEVIKMKFKGELKKIESELSRISAYDRVSSLDLIYRMERFHWPFSKNERRDFIKINEF